jgi:3-isopropylmalate dehydratase small subunit
VSRVVADGLPPHWEEPLPTLTGRAWAFGPRLTAADVLPDRVAAFTASEARRHLFADLDPTLAARIAPGDVLVTEEHAWAQPDRSAALPALAAAGIVALIGRVIAPVLERAALDAGIVAVVLDAPHFIHTGDRLRVDLEAAKVVNLSSGDRAAIRNLDETRRRALRVALAAAGRV